MEQKEKTIFSEQPVCDKDMTKTYQGYSCKGVSKEGKAFNFIVHHTYMGVNVTEKLARELVENYRTELLLFSQPGGQHDFGRLVLKDDSVEVEMDKHYLKGRCPVCGGRVIHTSKGYFCENYREGDNNSCQFHALGVLAYRQITEDNIEDFLSGKAEILDGFRSDDNIPFSGYLVLNSKKMLSVNSRICRCPRCGGMLQVGPTSFRCENFNDPEHPCKTRYYRYYGGVRINRKMMEELSRYGHTVEPLILTREDGRRYPACLAFNDLKTRILTLEQR